MTCTAAPVPHRRQDVTAAAEQELVSRRGAVRDANDVHQFASYAAGALSLAAAKADLTIEATSL